MNAQTSGVEFKSAGLEGASLIDRFAEALSELDNIEWACVAVNLTLDQGEALFSRMCRRLGPQAA